MIVQAKFVKGKPLKKIEPKESKIVRVMPRNTKALYNMTDKRFLICTDPITNGISAYVFDVLDQKIVYKVTTTKDVDEIYKDIYSSYKRSDTRIVDAISLKSVINKSSQPKGGNEALIFNTLKKDLNEVTNASIVLNFPIEPSHIRRIRDTYKYLDKYRIKLNIEAKHDIKSNKTTIFLFDEVSGVTKGTHRLLYEHEQRKYSYFYLDKLIGQTSELENLFRV